MKEKVLELRREGKSINVIQKITGLAKSTVSKYCKDNGLGGRADGKVRLSDDKVKEINEYYQTHTRQETADFFNMSPHSVKYYVEKKVTLLQKNKTFYV